MASVFISYRRSDSLAYTGRIYDRLVNAFGKNHIFKDVDDIPAGVDFREALDHALTAADIVLVMIGPQWLYTSDDIGKRRLSDPKDFVRIEVETALKRNDVLVIPVLVNNAVMPTADSLPPGLKDLAYRNSVVVRNDPDFNRDMGQLIKTIQSKLKPARRSRWLLLVVALLVLLGAALAGLRLLQSPATPTATSAAQIETQPATTTAIFETATTTVTDTVIVTSDVTPTVLYPDGRLLTMFYDDTTFVIYNPAGGQIRFDGLSFEAVEVPSVQFDGAKWARQYDFLRQEGCGAIKLPQFANHLTPKQCSAYNATVNNIATNELFWRTQTGTAHFRVLWKGEEVGQCAISAGRCEVRIPAS